MTSILFTCPNCANPLAVDEDLTAQSADCPACGRAIEVPRPDISYRCPYCRAPLSSPSTVVGAKANCPNCDRVIEVPERSAPALAHRQQAGSPSAVVRGPESLPEGRRCPQCAAAAPPTAIMCTNCGTDLRTGKPLSKRARSVNGTLVFWICFAALVALGAGGWYVWKQRKTAEFARVASIEAATAKAAQEAKALAEQQKLEAERQAAEVERQRVAAEREQAEAERQRKQAECERVDAENTRLRLARLRKEYLDAPDVGLLDALTVLSATKRLRLAVDPDVMESVSRVRVDSIDFARLVEKGGLQSFLAGHGLVIRACPMSETDTNMVALVTTEAIWGYCCASRQLGKKQLQAALKSLSSVPVDSSEFGGHGMALRKLLTELAEREMEQAKLASQVRRRLDVCAQHYRAAQMFMRGVSIHEGTRNSKPVGDRGVQQAAAKASYEKALGEIRAVSVDMSSFVRSKAAGDRALVDRFWDAYVTDLSVESAYLLDHFIETFELLRGLSGEIEKSGLLDDVKISGYYDMNEPMRSCKAAIRAYRGELADLPDDLRHIQDRLASRTKLSAGLTSAARMNLATKAEIEREMRASGRALACDRGNAMARAAAGFFRMGLYSHSLLDALGGVSADGASIDLLLRDLAAARKQMILKAAEEVAGRDGVKQSAAEADRVGAATGLWVEDGSEGGAFNEGGAFRVNVGIKPRVKETVSREVTVRASSGAITPYVGYWQSWSRTERQTFQVDSASLVFEDYGKKDVDLLISANEVYRWLCATFSVAMKDQAMHIAFHDLKSSKGGDSGGVTFAVAAYSAITNKPVSASVAMTGSLRADGTVYGIGAVFEKILAAVAAPQIELVVIPRSNEADAMLVPFDALCRTTIVSAEGIQTYLDYATNPEHNAKSLAKLRMAQALLLTGQKDRAELLLLDVAAECPEVFTARRLLEVIACWKKAKTTLLAQVSTR